MIKSLPKQDAWHLSELAALVRTTHQHDDGGDAMLMAMSPAGTEARRTCFQWTKGFAYLLSVLKAALCGECCCHSLFSKEKAKGERG